MSKGINQEKVYEDAVLSIVRDEEFKNVSAEIIEKIALFAVRYAVAGYDKGFNDVVSYYQEAQSNQKKKGPPPVVDATHNMSVSFEGDTDIAMTLTEADFKEAKEKVVEILTEIGDRY